jgi:iron complex outermembrane receptor protein
VKRALIILLLAWLGHPASIAVAEPADAGVPDASTDAAPPETAPAPPADAPTAEPPAGAPAKPAPPCTSTIDGHVVDGSTHEAVPGATVRVNSQPTAETDTNGRFTLRALCPGVVTVEVERADCAPIKRTVTLGATASLEIELKQLDNETIVVEAKAPDPADMRSTTVLSGAALERTRGRTFSDSLAEVPGVSQLRSATGMAKPIIRGQFGRRLLLLVDGVRHRAQEWGLDHAPEIDPFVADKLTVVRGASGVRYGPDAIGGAVLVDPPELLREPGFAGEAHLIGISNGRGGSFASRLQAASARVPGLAWQLEGSLKRFAAPSTPDYALDNTGVGEWNAGGTAGFRRGPTEYKLSYRHYQADLGVCSCLRIESADEFFAQIAQQRPSGSELFNSEFEIERPSQEVAHDLAIARASRKLDQLGMLVGTYSFQHDRRKEFDIVRDATTGAQFDFRLMTHELELAFEHNPIHLTDHLHLRGSAGLVGMGQFHRYSGLPLVPDHRGFAAGAYALERLIGHDFELEAGLRYDFAARTASIERRDFLRLVRSDQLAMDACGPGSPDPVSCASRFHTLSASIGGLYRFTDAWAGKLDLSTASRAPNPDEQYLNGTAPTFPVFGLGKPDLGSETTYSASATTTFHTDHVTAEASVYTNLITDYIYFSPAIDANGNPIFDVLIRGTFPRFITRPVDAVFFGADGGVAVTPHPTLELRAQLSIVRARNTTDDSYLVFVPADRLRGSVTYKRGSLGSFSNGFATVSGTYTARQERFDLRADFAPPPDAYFLLGAELGAEKRVGDQTFKLALQGTNLLNSRYRDYTSLLRYFADQPGWQLMLRLSMQFSSPDN